MKILFVHTKLADGGVTTVLINKMNYLAENSDIEVNFLSETDNEFDQEKKVRDKIKIHNLNVSENYPKNIFSKYFNEILKKRSTTIKLKTKLTHVT